MVTFSDKFTERSSPSNNGSNRGDPRISVSEKTLNCTAMSTMESDKRRFLVVLHLETRDRWVASEYGPHTERFFFLVNKGVEC